MIDWKKKWSALLIGAESWFGIGSEQDRDSIGRSVNFNNFFYCENCFSTESKLYFAYTVDSMRALGKKIVIFDIQRSILADRVIKSA